MVAANTCRRSTFFLKNGQCTKCHHSRYSSKECQAKDWESHKDSCKIGPREAKKRLMTAKEGQTV